MKAIVSSILILLSSACAHAATTKPATQPATTRAAVQISADAKPLLERIRKAYSGDRPLTVEGQIIGDFDVAARAHKYTLNFTAQADGKGRFVHRAADVGTLVRDQTTATVYDQKTNTFGVVKSSASRGKLAQVPELIADVLEDENPAILFMLVADPEEALSRRAKKISADKDKLIVETNEDRRTITLDTEGYVRELVIDYTPILRERGAAQIERAKVTLTYSRTDRGAAVDATAFDFDIPRGATEFDMEPRRHGENPELMRPRRPATTTTSPASAPATSD